MVWKEPNRKRRASDNNNSKKPSDPLHIRRQVTHKWPTLRWPTAAVLNPSQKVTHLGWVTFMMYLFDWPLFLSLFFLFLFPFPSLPFFFPSSLLFLLFFFSFFFFSYSSFLGTPSISGVEKEDAEHYTVVLSRLHNCSKSLLQVSPKMIIQKCLPRILFHRKKRFLNTKHSWILSWPFFSLRCQNPWTFLR